MNKYDKYCVIYEEKGLLKPIYKDDKITICNVGDFCYYMIVNEVGVAINISADYIRSIIENPEKTIDAYVKLPIETKKAVSFFVDKGNVEKLLVDIKNIGIKEPQRIVINSEVEKQIIQEFGMAGKKI